MKEEVKKKRWLWITKGKSGDCCYPQRGEAQMNNGAREAILMTGGLISTLCSGSVVLTGILFSKTMLSRTHPFSNMIFFISLCDMIGSIGMSFGYPDSDAIHCKAQAFLILFFFPASWMWTTCLVYQLRSMMFHKKLYVSMFTIHCLCWSMALLVALLPLSENSYGEDDDLEGRSVCYLTSTHKQRKFWWLFGLYYGLLIVCVVLMTYWMLSSARQIRVMRTTTFTDYKERAIYKATRWYPLGMLVTWTLSISVTIMLAIYSDAKVDYIQAGQIAQTQYGTMLAVIFFSNSKIVRHRWKELYRRVFRGILPHSNSRAFSDSESLDRASEDSLDPEGVKFSSEESMVDGPRLSEIAHILSFGVLQGSSQGSSAGRSRTEKDERMHSGDSSLEGSAETGEAGTRVSTYVRDWLVNSSKARQTAVEMGARSGSRSHSSSGLGRKMSGLFSFGVVSSTSSTSSNSSGDRDGVAMQPRAPKGSAQRGQQLTDGSADTVTSPLAAALERARADREAGAAGATGGHSIGALGVHKGGGGGTGTDAAAGSGITGGQELPVEEAVLDDTQP